jgi:hypothetical protein
MVSNNEIKEKHNWAAKDSSMEDDELDEMLDDARTDSAETEDQNCLAIIESRKDWLEQMKTTPDDNGELWDEKELQHQIDCCDMLIEEVQRQISSMIKRRLK